MTSTELRAEDIRWDLTDLCAGAEQARAEWTALVERAQELASRYRGELAALDAAGFRALLDVGRPLVSRSRHQPGLRRDQDQCTHQVRM